MIHQIFLNLAVKDLPKTVAFWTELGFQFNQNFTDEKATCLVLGENMFVMLLVESFFQTFTKKQICDTRSSVEGLTALSVESRAKVDEIVEKALAAGATTTGDTQDHGWMYSRGFEDLDGHHWDFMYMDPTAAAPTQA